MINQPILNQEFSNIRNIQQPQNPPHYLNSQPINSSHRNFDLKNQHSGNLNNQTIPNIQSQELIMSRHPSMPKFKFTTNEGQNQNVDQNKKLRETILTQVTENNNLNSHLLIGNGQTNRLNSTIGDYELSHRQNVPVISPQNAWAINQNSLNTYGRSHIQAQQNIRPNLMQLNSMTYPTYIPNNNNKFNEFQKPIKLFTNKQQKSNFYNQKRSEPFVQRENTQFNRIYQNPQIQTKYLSNNSNATEDVQYTYKQRPLYTKTYNNDTEWYRTVGPQQDPVTKKTNCNVIAYLCAIIGILGLLAAIFFGFGLFKQWFSNNNNSPSAGITGLIQNGSKNQSQNITPVLPINNQPTQPLTPTTNNLILNGSTSLPLTNGSTITPITYPTILQPTINYNEDNKTFINSLNSTVQEPKVIPQNSSTFIQPIRPANLSVTAPATLLPTSIPQISKTVNPEIISQVNINSKPILPEIIPVVGNTVQPLTAPEIKPTTITPTVFTPTTITPTTITSTTIAPTTIKPTTITPTVFTPTTITPTTITPTTIAPTTITPTTITPTVFTPTTITPTTIAPTTITPTTITPTAITPTVITPTTITPTVITPTTITPTAITPTVITSTTITPTTITPTTITLTTITPIESVQIGITPTPLQSTVPQNFKSKLTKELQSVNGNFKASISPQLYDMVPQNFKAHFTINKVQ